jgi:O-antigen/teichoic acid export membrane protein
MNNLPGNQKVHSRWFKKVYLILITLTLLGLVAGVSVWLLLPKPQGLVLATQIVSGVDVIQYLFLLIVIVQVVVHFKEIRKRYRILFIASSFFAVLYLLLAHFSPDSYVEAAQGIVFACAMVGMAPAVFEMFKKTR